MTDTLTIPTEWARDDRWEVYRKLGPLPFPEWDSDDDYPSAKHTIRARVGLDKIPGNESPYFSATVDVYEGSKDVGGGAMTEEIARLWPDAEIVSRIHGSWYDGRPMHAVANGVHWLGRAGFPDARDLDVLKRHLRIDDVELRSLLSYVDDGVGVDHDHGWYRERLDAWLVESGVVARWADEAAAARRWIETEETR